MHIIDQDRTILDCEKQGIVMVRKKLTSSIACADPWTQRIDLKRRLARWKNQRSNGREIVHQSDTNGKAWRGRRYICRITEAFLTEDKGF